MQCMDEGTSGDARRETEVPPGDGRVRWLCGADAGRAGLGLPAAADRGCAGRRAPRHRAVRAAQRGSGA
ncbi:hypothetical protein G6F64_014968 [Rhizopus arrhizus]|uniref:Uncharacterized protein n=1 Tax=Rhizopus oryzae TaxID=64495 RepID=A0A9P6WT68_RHIOR|nr:hypothetical protein G6F64_014968 [Rhizopus arrhizus]